MTPDDPRHGSTAGWAAGCRQDCCLAAKARYDKRSYHERSHGITRSIDNTGFIRRIRALQAMGWSFNDIAQRIGIPRTCLTAKTRNHTRVYVSTFRRMVAVYDELSMIPGPSIRSINAAKRNGWAPPLAWDDIDDPDERPNLGAAADRGVDEVLVQRALSGQQVKANRAERAEIIRRWTGSHKQLIETQRWNWRVFKEAS